MLSTTSGVQPGSSLRPLLFCFFINDLAGILRFTEWYLSSIELKKLVIGHRQSNVQNEIDAIDPWLRKNHMELAIGKCSTL